MMIDMEILQALLERGLFVSGIEMAIVEESTDIPLELIEAYKEYKQADINFRSVITKHFGVEE